MGSVLRIGAVAVVSAAILFTASPASAATPPVGVFAVITSTGAGFDATFPAASGMPTAHITTDASASPAAGASAFLGATTTFGAQYGSSRKQPYLSVPAVPPFSTSTTTITFDSPTPAGWGFALGDIDADYVSIVAANGPTALTTAQLGVQAPGNYCEGASPSPSTCSGVTAPFDVPAWCGDPVPASGCVGKPVDTLLGSGGDSSGAYGWFRPTVPVTSVTLRFTPQLGFPTFQLWLVAMSPAATVTGTIVTPDPLPANTSLALLDGAGAPVTDFLDQPVMVPVDTGGSFAFETAFGDYQLDFDPPPGVDVDPGVFPLAISADSDVVALGSIELADAVDPGADPADPAQLVATGVDPVLPLGIAALLVAGGVLTVRRRRVA